MPHRTDLSLIAHRPTARHQPCPRWCALAGAHPFAAEGYRIHTRRVGRWMAVEQVETTDHTFSPAVKVDDDVELTPGQVADFTADLERAAAVIEGAR